MSKKVFVGIDPDCDRSGVALWHPSTKKLILGRLSFFDLMKRMEILKDEHDIHVILEAGWLIPKSNFHKWSKNESKAAGERIAKNVGANHETGKKIEEMLKHLKVPYQLVKPKGKVTPEYFKMLTGQMVKCQDIIDAGMLVFGL